MSDDRSDDAASAPQPLAAQTLEVETPALTENDGGNQSQPDSEASESTFRLAKFLAALSEPFHASRVTRDGHLDDEYEAFQPSGFVPPHSWSYADQEDAKWSIEVPKKFVPSKKDRAQRQKLWDSRRMTQTNASLAHSAALTQPTGKPYILPGISIYQSIVDEEEGKYRLSVGINPIASIPAGSTRDTRQCYLLYDNAHELGTFRAIQDSWDGAKDYKPQYPDLSSIAAFVSKSAHTMTQELRKAINATKNFDKAHKSEQFLDYIDRDGSRKEKRPLDLDKDGWLTLRDEIGGNIISEYRFHWLDYSTLSDPAMSDEDSDAD